MKYENQYIEHVRLNKSKSTKKVLTVHLSN